MALAMAKKTYHHGNLRQALVEASLDVLAQNGAGGFSLAHAAKAAGVTPAAVYRHFKGREDLMAEVARQGHERLALLTDTAMRDHEPHRAALAYGAAFVTFATKFSGHFNAIYLSGLSSDQFPALLAAEARSAHVLTRLATGLQNSVQTVPQSDLQSDRQPASAPPEIADIACHVQALCLGIVLSGARSGAGSAGAGSSAMLESALRLYLDGLTQKTS